MKVISCQCCTLIINITTQISLRSTTYRKSRQTFCCLFYKLHSKKTGKHLNHPNLVEHLVVALDQRVQHHLNPPTCGLVPKDQVCPDPTWIRQTPKTAFDPSSKIMTEIYSPRPQVGAKKFVGKWNKQARDKRNWDDSTLLYTGFYFKQCRERFGDFHLANIHFGRQ